jgi:biopolymer transport protein ExbB/TolQ
VDDEDIERRPPGDIYVKAESMKRSVKITLISSGVLTFVAPVIGLLGTVLGMTKGFGVIGSTKAADPAELSAGIAMSLVSTVSGLVLGVISLFVFIVMLIYWLCTRHQQSKASAW